MDESSPMVSSVSSGKGRRWICEGHPRVYRNRKGKEQAERTAPAAKSQTAFPVHPFIPKSETEYKVSTSEFSQTEIVFRGCEYNSTSAGRFLFVT